jgi:ABC-type oligopeptide transport system ATPase subunit
MSEKSGIDDQMNKLSEGDRRKYIQELEKQALNPLENKLFSEHEINQKIASLTLENALNLEKEALAPCLKALLDREDSITQIANAAIVFPIISIAGSFLRDKVIVEGPSSDLFLNTWILPIGPSGCGKSTGAKPVLDLIRELENPVKEKYAKDLKHYNREMKKFLKAEEKGEEMEEPKAPVNEMISFPLVTSLERIIEMLSDGMTYGLMATDEEISIMLKKVKEVPALKELLISLYGGNISNNLVSYKSSKNLNLPNKALISILGPITTKSLSNNLSDEDLGSGFFARLNLIDCSNSKPPIAFPRRNKKLLNLDPIKHTLIDLWSFGLYSTSNITLKLDNEATQHYEQVIFEDYKYKKNKFCYNDVLISCLDRYWREALFKIAGIIHCLEYDFRNSKLISIETLAQAETLVQYIEDTTIKFLNSHKLSGVINMAVKIVNKLRDEKDYEVKINSLANSLRGYDRNREQFNLALEKLKSLTVIDLKNEKNKSNNGELTILVRLMQK